MLLRGCFLQKPPSFTLFPGRFSRISGFQGRWLHTSRPLHKVWSPLLQAEILEGLEKSRDADDYTNPLLTLEMCREYTDLPPEDKQDTLRTLAADMGVQPQRFRPLLSSLCTPPGGGGLEQGEAADPSAARSELAQLRKLKRQMIPLYEALFRHLINLPEGLKFLVGMRADLLRVLQQQEQRNGSQQQQQQQGEERQGGRDLTALDRARLKYLDQELKFLLGNWFHIGLLELRRVLWSDSAELLEKIAEYEAVHPIANVSDLKQRVGGGRRLFAFFHPVLPEEPVVMVNVALTLNGILHNIHDILRIPTEEAQRVEEALVNDPAAEGKGTAIFYSITSPHRVRKTFIFPSFSEWS